MVCVLCVESERVPVQFIRLQGAQVLPLPRAIQTVKTGDGAAVAALLWAQSRHQQRRVNQGGPCALGHPPSAWALGHREPAVSKLGAPGSGSNGYGPGHCAQGPPQGCPVHQTWPQEGGEGQRAASRKGRGRQAGQPLRVVSSGGNLRRTHKSARKVGRGHPPALAAAPLGPRAGNGTWNWAGVGAAADSEKSVNVTRGSKDTARPGRITKQGSELLGE